MSSPHSQSQVAALVGLISDAARIIEVQYAKSSQPSVPSLDDTTPHPLDSQIAPMELKLAIQTLEGACAQLCATVARPNHTVTNKVMGIYEPGCLQVVVTFKIPDILLDQPEGMHISEISKRSGVEQEKLGRILRLLATKHVFREVSKNVFANNRLSVQLLSTNPLSGLALHFTDENAKSTAVLPETLAHSEWGHSYAPEHSSFNMWSKHPKSLFDWYEGATPEGAKQGERFGIGMIGWGKTVDAGAVIDAFPWSELGPGATVCDVGGGIGAITLQLAKAYPTLQLKLQDLPDRMVQAETVVWPRECPEAIKEQRIEFKTLDFFSESPIKDCDVYFLKNIIHDWPDKACIQILRGVRAAMKPSSRVLIQEFVLQYADRVADESSKFKQAPEPLLPNYGVGKIRQYNLDIDMMVMLNSQERYLEGFIQLGKEAGLRFEKFWDLPGEMGVIELRLA